MNLNDLLATKGIAIVDLGYGAAEINDWNVKLDEIFHADAANARSYVDAHTLLECGVLKPLFDRRMRSAITHLFDDPVIYHCHAYEIAGKQNESHIHSGALCGWHGDHECLPYHREDKAYFVSFFVYLTDVVSAEDGAFELRPQSPRVPLRHGQPSIQMIGSAGTTFAFNRAFAHRARPNRCDKRRRVLKVSVQERHLPHERRELDEFTAVYRALEATNNDLAYLFDTTRLSPKATDVGATGCCLAFPGGLPPINSAVELGIAGRLKTAIGGGRIAA